VVPDYTWLVNQRKSPVGRRGGRGEWRSMEEEGAFQAENPGEFASAETKGFLKKEKKNILNSGDRWKNVDKGRKVGG